MKLKTIENLLMHSSCVLFLLSFIFSWAFYPGIIITCVYFGILLCTDQSVRKLFNISD